MAFPRTLSGTAFPAQNYFLGAFRDGNGNNYVCVLDSTDISLVEVWKSDDGDAVWAEVDGSNRPDSLFGITSMSVFQDGTRLKLATMNTDLTLEYHEFAMSDDGSADQWITTIEEVDLDPSTEACSITIRSDNDRVILHAGNNDNIKGTNYDRLSYALWEGVSWNLDNAVDDGGEINYFAASNVLGASDKCHFFFQDDTNSDLLHKSFTSGNSLSSVETVSDTNTNAINFIIAPGVFYDAASTERITIGWVDSSGQDLYTSEIDADGVPSAEEQVSADNVQLNGEQAVACLAVDPATDKVYAVWSNASQGQDIYFDENDNSGGWGTDTEAEDAVTCNDISVGLYDNDGGDTVLAILFDDGGTVKYTEEVVEAGGTTFFQTNTGALTFVGSVLKKTLKPLSGALTFVGDVAKKALKPLSGVLTFSGDVFKKMFEALAGVLTFSGDVTAIKMVIKAVAGTLTFSGNVFKKMFEDVSGTLTFVGNVAKKALKPLSGTLTFSGIVATIKIQFQTNTGALTFSGNVVKKTLKLLAGALTFAGDVVTLPKKLLTGVLTFAGSLAKKTLKPSLAGILNFSGDVFKKMFEALAGILTFVGDVDPVLLKKQAVAGVLTFSGDVVTLPKKLLTGVLTFSGDVVTLPKKLLSGALTFSGNVFKKTLKVLSGVLNFTGVVVASKIAFQAVAGVLTFSGDIAKKALLARTGALIFSGDVTTLPKKLLTGVLTFSGDIAKKAEVARAGVLTFSGNVFKKTLKLLTGVLTFSGDAVGVLNAVIQQAVSGVLTFAGNVTTVKIQFITLTGVLTFSGSLIKTIGKILSGILTPSGTVQKKTMKVVVGSLNFVGTVGAFEPIIATDTLQGTHITSVSIVGEHDITDTLEGEHDTTDTLEGNV